MNLLWTCAISLFVMPVLVFDRFLKGRTRDSGFLEACSWPFDMRIIGMPSPSFSVDDHVIFIWDGDPTRARSRVRALSSVGLSKSIRPPSPPSSGRLTWWKRTHSLEKKYYYKGERRSHVDYPRILRCAHNISRLVQLFTPNTQSVIERYICSKQTCIDDDYSFYYSAIQHLLDPILT